MLSSSGIDAEVAGNGSFWVGSGGRVLRFAFCARWCVDILMIGPVIGSSSVVGLGAAG